MAMLQPKLSILDETDSGLDVDAMRIVARWCEQDAHFGDFNHRYHPLRPTFGHDKTKLVHILYNGRIVKTGGPELAREIEKRGYDWIKAEADK